MIPVKANERVDTPLHQKAGLQAILIAGVLVCGPAVARAQALLAPAWEGRPLPRASIVSPEGEPLLLIHYPWSEHAKASLEVWLVPTLGGLPGVAPKPIYFRGNEFRGDLEEWTYRCVDSAQQGEVKRVITTNDVKYTIIGRPNHRGQPAVEVLRTLPEGSPPGALALYPILRGWGLTPMLLSIDLPAVAFDPAGKLYLTFLRDHEVLWREELDWPGRK
ncbi:MAG: hypothetical protein ACOY3P_10980 [Planctomycetota bacterium]